MATQSQGIQQLLAAEKKAAEIVAEAGKKRTKRLKQAKDEAVIDVEAFKAEKEKAHKILEQQILGSRSTNDDSIKIKTENLIKEMTESFEANNAKTMQDILDAVSQIDVEKHKNFI